MRHFLHQYKNLFLLAGLVGGYIYLAIQPIPVFGEKHETLCLFHLATGLPCPVCGTGRGLICLLHGHLYQALLFNPLCIVVLLLSVLVAFSILKDVLKKTDSLSRLIILKIPAAYYVMFGLLLLANELWNIHKGL